MPMIEKRNVSLNLNVRGLGQSATLDIQDRVRRMRREGRRVHNLGLGQSPFPVPQSVVDTLRLHAGKKDYLPVEGLPELKEAVAQYHHDKRGVEFQPEHVLIGPGTKELLFLLQLSFYGEILVPSPCWVSYTPQARIIGRNVRYVPTTFEEDWKVTPERMREVLESEQDRYRPRLFVLNYPSNPVGVTYRRGELKEIAKVAREFEVILLSDEIYSGLHFTGDHTSVARYYPRGTIVLDGISKWCGAGGWRLGAFSFPPELDWLRKTMAAVASETYTSVSAPIQYAAVKAFQGGMNMEHYLWHARRILRTLGTVSHRKLTGAGVQVALPQGGFYLFPDFSPFRDELADRGIRDSRTLCARLLEEAGVAMLPGSSFERPPEELTARLAYVDFDGARALTRSETIPLDQPLPEDFLDRCCGNVVEAMDAVAGWLHEGGK